MDVPGDEGLGLDYEALRLERTTEGWVNAGSALRDEVESTLRGVAERVEQIGSSSVPGLLAKPIIDIAVGIAEPGDLVEVRRRLERAGWIHRGDAGDEGGHVFVLETRPWHRVAHIHVVHDGSPQWVNYLRFRDLLRHSRRARERYEAVKVRLVEEVGDDRTAYTDGKSDVVQSLLGDLDAHLPPTLYMLCGLPGSGKTTRAKELEAAGEGVVLNADDWVWRLYPDDAEAAARDERKGRVERVQWELVERLLRGGISVILDWGVWTRAERDHYRQRAHDLGATVRIVFLDVPIETLHERVAQRNRSLPTGTFRISAEELDEWAASFEPPSRPC